MDRKKLYSWVIGICLILVALSFWFIEPKQGSLYKRMDANQLTEPNEPDANEPTEP